MPDFTDILAVPDHGAQDILVALEKSNPTGINQYTGGHIGDAARKHGGSVEELRGGAVKATFHGKDGTARTKAFIKDLPAADGKKAAMSNYRDGSATVHVG